MADEKFLVRAYTTRDGTQLKEHYRNAPEGSIPDGGSETTPQESQGAFGDLSGGDTQQSDAQTGKDIGLLPEVQIPMDDYQEEKVEGALQGYARYDETSAVQEQKPNQEPAKAQIEISQTVTDAADAATELAKGAVNVTPEQKIGIKQKLLGAISKLKQSHKESEQQEQELLNKLSTTKDQKEYSKALQDYSKLREKNQKLKDNLARVNYYNENGNYENLVEELNMLKQDFDTVRELNTRERPLKMTQILEAYKEMGDPTNPAVNEMVKDETAKYVLDATKIPNKVVKSVVHIYNKYWTKNAMYDADKMFEASATDFAKSKDYVNKNGSLVYSINGLPSEDLQNIVKAKVKKQLKTDDAVGMIFNSNSNLSKQIAISPEMKKHFQEHRDALLNHKVVTGGSTSYRSNGNLYNALGKADFVYTFIDKDENLCAVTLDTYDFNSFDFRFKVMVAHALQKQGTLRNYYSINVSRTPKRVWSSW